MDTKLCWTFTLKLCIQLMVSQETELVNILNKLLEWLSEDHRYPMLPKANCENCSIDLDIYPVLDISPYRLKTNVAKKDVILYVI